jgi:hypothetical protein
MKNLLFGAVCLCLGGAAAQALPEPPPGFTPLFNGKNIENWRGGTTPITGRCWR